jgi:hypothetical protein
LAEAEPTVGFAAWPSQYPRLGSATDF